MKVLRLVTGEIWFIPNWVRRKGLEIQIIPQTPSESCRQHFTKLGDHRVIHRHQTPQRESEAQKIQSADRRIQEDILFRNIYVNIITY